MVGQLVKRRGGGRERKSENAMGVGGRKGGKAVKTD